MTLDAEVALLKLVKQNTRAANTTWEFCQLLSITETTFLSIYFLKGWWGKKREGSVFQNIPLTSL